MFCCRKRPTTKYQADSSSGDRGKKTTKIEVISRADEQKIDKKIAAGGFDQYREFGDTDMSFSAKLEHYQPAEFPLKPVITTSTHAITNSSWKLIKDAKYEDPEAKEGEVNGAIFFYNTFFRMLFERSADLRIKFPTVFLQATVMSKVIGLCLSIEYGKLELQITEIEELGRKHRTIVNDPWHFSVYATTLHSTFKLALGENATPETMKAWLNVLAFILRHMLPAAITPDHIRDHAGALNAAATVGEKEQKAIMVNQQYSDGRSDMLSMARNLVVARDQGSKHKERDAKSDMEVSDIRSTTAHDTRLVSTVTSPDRFFSTAPNPRLQAVSAPTMASTV